MIEYGHNWKVKDSKIEKDHTPWNSRVVDELTAAQNLKLLHFLLVERTCGRYGQRQFT